jgi:hypothetical protein
MEYKDKSSTAGPLSTQLVGRVGHGKEKVGEKRRFRDACDTWGVEGATKGLVREVGREARNSQTRGRKRTRTSRVAVKAKEKKRLWRSHLGKRA